MSPAERRREQVGLLKLAAVDVPALARAWHDAVRAVGAVADNGAVDAAGRRLLAAYAEPHRAYHDLVHLGEVLARVDELAAEAADVIAVRLAAWFHDAVYDLSAGAEERSAALGEQMLLRLGLTDAVVTEVARLVRLTASHDTSADDRNGSVLIDADLAILAAPTGRYARYVAGVRTEYAAYDDASFARGRAQVLRDLLALPRLFRTSTGAGWEARARANVEQELLGLERALDSG